MERISGRVETGLLGAAKTARKTLTPGEVQPKDGFTPTLQTLQDSLLQIRQTLSQDTSADARALDAALAKTQQSVSLEKRPGVRQSQLMSALEVVSHMGGGISSLALSQAAEGMLSLPSNPGLSAGTKMLGQLSEHAGWQVGAQMCQSPGLPLTSLLSTLAGSQGQPNLGQGIQGRAGAFLKDLQFSSGGPKNEQIWKLDTLTQEMRSLAESNLRQNMVQNQSTTSDLALLQALPQAGDGMVAQYSKLMGTMVGLSGGPAEVLKMLEDPTQTRWLDPKLVATSAQQVLQGRGLSDPALDQKCQSLAHPEPLGPEQAAQQAGALLATWKGERIEETAYAHQRAWSMVQDLAGRIQDPEQAKLLGDLKPPSRDGMREHTARLMGSLTVLANRQGPPEGWVQKISQGLKDLERGRSGLFSTYEAQAKGWAALQKLGANQATPYQQAILQADSRLGSLDELASGGQPLTGALAAEELTKGLASGLNGVREPAGYLGSIAFDTVQRLQWAEKTGSADPVRQRILDTLEPVVNENRKQDDDYRKGGRLLGALTVASAAGGSLLDAVQAVANARVSGVSQTEMESFSRQALLKRASSEGTPLQVALLKNPDVPLSVIASDPQSIGLQQVAEPLQTALGYFEKADKKESFLLAGGLEEARAMLEVARQTGNDSPEMKVMESLLQQALTESRSESHSSPSKAAALMTVASALATPQPLATACDSLKRLSQVKGLSDYSVKDSGREALQALLGDNATDLQKTFISLGDFDRTLSLLKENQVDLSLAGLKSSVSELAGERYTYSALSAASDTAMLAKMGDPAARLLGQILDRSVGAARQEKNDEDSMRVLRGGLAVANALTDSLQPEMLAPLAKQVSSLGYKARENGFECMKLLVQQGGADWQKQVLLHEGLSQHSALELLQSGQPPKPQDITSKAADALKSADSPYELEAALKWATDIGPMAGLESPLRGLQEVRSEALSCQANSTKAGWLAGALAVLAGSPDPQQAVSGLKKAWDNADLRVSTDDLTLLLGGRRVLESLTPDAAALWAQAGLPSIEDVARSRTPELLSAGLSQGLENVATETREIAFRTDPTPSQTEAESLGASLNGILGLAESVALAHKTLGQPVPAAVRGVQDLANRNPYYSLNKDNFTANASMLTILGQSGAEPTPANLGKGAAAVLDLVQQFPNTLKGEVAAKEALNMLEKLAEANGIQQFSDLVNEAGYGPRLPVLQKLAQELK